MIQYFYIVLIVLAAIYLLYLFFPKTKLLHFLGVGRKLKKILQANKTLQKNHKKKTEEAIQNIEALFTSGGRVDYVKLFDKLQKLKSSTSNLCFVIDLLLEIIQSKHPYYLLSHDKEEVFNKATLSINNSDKAEALSDLKVIYKQFVSTEDEYHRKGRIEFWIGLLLAIISLIIGIVPFFS